MISINLDAQELPPIANFSPEIYNAGNQNWMISQAHNKYIYVANNSGLLENNGAKWKLYSSPNGTIIRSVKVIGEFIYTGSYMEFGYWEKDTYGDLTYNSLINKLNVPLLEDEQFWNILEYGDWVLFQSLDRIYFYNTINKSFNIIDSKTTRAELFIVGNNIYFQKINEGIFKIENGKSILVTENPLFQQNVLVGAFLIDKKTLFLTEKGGFYFLKDKNLTKWNIPAYEELSLQNVYSSLQLNDGSIVLGTISKGIYHLDNSGNILKNIDKEKGLNNNTVLSIFEDIENNLWVGLDNGISILNLKSPFSVYNDLKGSLGVVYAAKTFENHLYVGTNQGLFYKRLNENSTFKLIENTEGQVWCLKEINKTLFCGHNNGTYIIKDNNAEQISEFPGTWDIKEIEKNENLLLQGNFEGLSILEKTNNGWKFRNKIIGFGISSRFFEFINDHQILVNHDVKGIFKLNIDQDYRLVFNEENEETHGYGSSLIKYNNDIIHSSNFNREVLKYNIEKSRFIKDTFLTNNFYSEENNILGTLISDSSTNKIWGFSNSNIIYFSPGKFNNTPEEVKIPVSSTFRKSLGVVGFENLTHLEDENFLIGSSNGYAILNLNKLKTKEYTVKINSIYKDFPSSLSEKVSLNNNAEFKSIENNLSFYFSVPEYDKFTDVEYQYQLEGIYDDWSFWFNEPNASFKNLSFGDYTFNVRARVGNNDTSNIETYNFSIDKPWYLTNSMLILYVFVLLLIFLMIHRAYKKHYTEEHKRIVKKTQRKLKIENLEKEQQLMKFKNDNLRLDIENKNRELGLSTMNLIKKNEFLNNIKKELKQDNSPSHLNYVIKIIDKNINNSDDWILFEEAFNNADKDFFKKIKVLHPSLTPNDLKLCAYLRLNLSSKEIAPLLNISTKSVEVKRYRLRKKINLSHDSSLSSYIFEI